ncbi:MAG: hypothetical protein WA990_05690 [Rubrobacteraceae bacterium]
MEKVLFVCTANICRSPTAEAIFNALAEDTGLSFRAESAGTAALAGKPMAPNAEAALIEAGIYPGNHHARQVNEAMLRGAGLVLAMTPRHVAKLRSLYGELARETYTLPGYATSIPNEEGIPDPYGHTMVAYRSSVRLLYEYIERVVNRLAT